MTEQENMDKLIRQKFAEKEFVFNEENWEKAEKKIDSSRRLNKIVRWSTIFIIGLFSGIILTLVFVNKENTKNTKPFSEINQQNKSDNNNEALNKENSKEEKSSSSLNSGKQNKNDVSQKDVEKENSTEVKNSLTTSEIQKTENDGSTSAITSISKPKLAKANLPDKKTISSHVSDQALITPKKENKIFLQKKNLPEKDLKEPEIKANEIPQKNTKKISLKKNSEKSNLVPSLTQLAQTEKPLNQPQTVASALTIKSEEKNNSETQSAEQPKNTAIESTEKNEAKSNSITKADQPLTIAAIRTEKNESIINSGTQNQDQSQTNVVSAIQKSETKSISMADSAKQIENQLVAKEIEKQKIDSSIVSQQNKLISPPPPAPLGGLASATIISVDAGTNIELGWKYADATEGRGFNPILGIGITHYLNQKWSLCSGVQYGSIAYLKVSQKTFSNITYGFGSTSIDTVINTNFLHYAVVPILFQYSFNDKNSISIGGSISYLVNAKSKVTINTTTVNAMITDSNEVSSTSKTAIGYYANAFNRWDASLAIGYRRRISQKFNLSAIANFGLLDIKNNAFFTKEKFERNIGLKITLSYTLFDF